MTMLLRSTAAPALAVPFALVAALTVSAAAPAAALAADDLTSDYLASIAEVHLDKTSYTWTGKAIKPKVTYVFLWGDYLQCEAQPGTGYEVVGYSANKKIGTGRVKLRCLIDGARGTWTVPFTIAEPKAGTKVSASRTSDGNAYKVLSGGTVQLTKWKSKKTTAKVGSVRFGGKKFRVASIAGGAFEGTKVKSVTLGKQVDAVGARALAGARKLRKVTLGAGVTKVGAKAFSGCGKLREVTVKSGLLTASGVKSSLRGSSIKRVKLSGVSGVKALLYERYFAKSNSGRSVKVG